MAGNELKIIALDFDGVLNSAAWSYPVAQGTKSRASESRARLALCPRSKPRRGHYDAECSLALDPAAIGLLNQLVDRTGAVVVISSTWRQGYSHNALQKLLQSRGFIGQVVGKTPEIECYPGEEGHWRWEEIVDWLKSSACPAPLSKARLVVLDDEKVIPASFAAGIATGEYGITALQVQTDYAIGLNQYDVDEAVKFLNAQGE